MQKFNDSSKFNAIFQRFELKFVIKVIKTTFLMKKKIKYPLNIRHIKEYP